MNQGRINAIILLMTAAVFLMFFSCERIDKTITGQESWFSCPGITPEPSEDFPGWNELSIVRLDPLKFEIIRGSWINLASLESIDPTLYYEIEFVVREDGITDSLVYPPGYPEIEMVVNTAVSGWRYEANVARAKIRLTLNPQGNRKIMVHYIYFELTERGAFCGATRGAIHRVGYW